MPPKRKRPERAPSDGGSRPSPHRPAETTLGQHDRDDGGARIRGRGGQRGGPHRRDSSSGRGGPHNSHNSSPSRPRKNSTSQAPTPATSGQPAASGPNPMTAPPPPAPKPAVPTSLPPSQPLNHTAPTDRQYEHLTDDRLKKWSETGRKDTVAHGCQSRDDVDITELSSLFQEFIFSVLEKRLDPRDAGACVKEILGAEIVDTSKEPSFAPHSLFLDSLAVILDIGTHQPDQSLRTFLQASEVSVSLMRQVLEAPVLQQLGLIRDHFAKVGVRQATNLLYRQANFNLLREEAEGYSKLITELYMTSDALHPDVPQETFEKIKALIGTFDLDVGRVLDVTLDVSAAVLVKQFKFFVKLLRVSSWWPREGPKDPDCPFTGGLPMWANPGYPQWMTSEEDEAINAQRKLERDIAFWDRARDVQLAAFFELGGRKLPSSEDDKGSLNGHNEFEEQPSAEQTWKDVTNTLPPSGNRVAANLLGFKLLFYYSKSRDQTDVLPANLLYLAALLVKIGFISFTDLYSHLSPDDDNMERVREKKMKEIEDAERKSRGGQMNALLMAGVLPQGEDDNPNAPSAPRTDTSKKSETEKKPETADNKDTQQDEPHEQKVSLLIQLLTIGAIPESLFILGRFPWIPEAFPEVLDCIHRLLHVCLSKVYDEASPSPVRGISVPIECPIKNVPDPDQSGLPKGKVRLSRMTTKKILKWPTADKNDHNDTQDYRYYWDEWTDNVPVCQTVDDVFTLCDTLLNTSGVNIGKDAALLSKLATIGSKSLHEDTSEFNMKRWKELLKRLLLPALSHTKANASIVEAVWSLLRKYPTTVRFALYAEWFEGQISRLPSMKKVFAMATAETRATMKRVSLTNLSEMAKRLAKTSYSSPGIVFSVAFEQMESYPNLIEAFVECAKYFTDLSYDVLIWSLMNSLGKSRSRTQAEHALTTSKWLQALSRFVGKVFRRYSILNPVPVLRYVNQQLVLGNSTDLIILREFISSMGGIVDTTDFTDNQILCISGGENLRRQTLIRGGDKRFENIRSSQRLIKSLTEAGLTVQILLNLAQYRQAALFRVDEEEAHIKYLSSILDDSHRILLQYLDFIWSNLDAATFNSLVPSVTELMTTFGLEAPLAFLIRRAALSEQMLPWGPEESESATASEEKSKPTLSQVEPKAGVPTEAGQSGEMDKKLDSTQEAGVVSAEPGAGTDPEGDAIMSDAKNSELRAETLTQKAGDADVQAAAEVTKQQEASKEEEEERSRKLSMVKANLEPIVKSVQQTMPAELWQKFPPQLYVAFWVLQLGDIFHTRSLYQTEKRRVNNEMEALNKDRSDMTRRGQERKSQKIKQFLTTSTNLIRESSKHGKRTEVLKGHIKEMASIGVEEPHPSAESIADALLEHCFIPRILISPVDAEYTYRFIMYLHEAGVPGFKLMAMCDRLFNANRLRSLIFSSSVREVENLGRFLKLLLGDLSRWHKNEITKDADEPHLGTYDREGKGTLKNPRLGFALTIDEDGVPQTFVEHAQFQDMLFRWHKNLNMALKSCLGGTEWMHIRNALTVLKAVLDFFPAIDFMATQFSNQLQSITKKEAASKTASEDAEAHRVDLSVAAQGALSELQRRKSKWIMVQAFRPNSHGGAPSTNDKSELRPTAPEFKPPATKAEAKPHNTNNNEKEDGEVQDNAKSKLSEPKPKATEGPATDNLPPKPSPAARDTPRRDATANTAPPRSSTPKASQGTGHGGYRNDTRANALPDRPPHNLPTRPDVPIPGHFNGAPAQPRNHDRRDPRDPRESRGGGPRDNRDARDPREPREPRDPRETRDPREGWPADVEWADRNRDVGERRAADNSREGNRPDVTPRSGAHERERTHRAGRTHETSGPHSASQQSTPAAQEPAVNPERLALLRQEGPNKTPRGSEADSSTRGRRQPAANPPIDNVNPDRAALIGDGADGTPTRPPVSRDDPRDRGPRAHSPRRASGRYGQDHHPQPERAHDDRLPRPHPAEHLPPGRPRGGSPQPGSYRGERPMDSREAHRPGSRGHEYDYRAPYDDQNYGRLNPIQSVGGEIPSGPRGRGGRAPRGGHGPHATHGGHGPPPPGPEGRYGPNNAQRPPSPERYPPTGPSGGRNNGRRGPHDPPTGPSTPSSAGPAQGDRMRNANTGAEKPQQASGVHPDRLAQMGGSGSSNAPTAPQSAPPTRPSAHNDHRHQVQSSATPERPKGDLRSAAPGNVAPPLAPEGSERGRAGGSRRQLAGINNMLQANKPEPPSRSNSRRGHQPRQMLANSDVQVLTGGSPVQTPNQERSDPMRHDAGHKGHANGEDTPQKDDNRGGRDREGRSDRSGRPSRRSSRDRDRDRSPNRDKDSKEHRDYRDRRSGAGAEGSQRDERDSRRSGRGGGKQDLMGPPPPGGPREHGGAGGGGGRDHRHSSGQKPGEDVSSNHGGGRGSSRGGPPKDGGGGGGGGRPEEQRGDRSRKRRSEGETGGSGGDREKRQRR